jgi:hypothetical protein
MVVMLQGAEGGDTECHEVGMLVATGLHVNAVRMVGIFFR